jgi:hypothetical protein
MNATGRRQLRYYIPCRDPGRRPADGTEPYLRPEVGFNPNWFHVRCGIDFSERWHEDPDYRLETLKVMAAEIRRRFPGPAIGGVIEGQEPQDLLTGAYGAAAMGRIIGLSIRYFPNAGPAMSVRPFPTKPWCISRRRISATMHSSRESSGRWTERPS